MSFIILGLFFLDPTIQGRNSGLLHLKLFFTTSKYFTQLFHVLQSTSKYLELLLKYFTSTFTYSNQLRTTSSHFDQLQVTWLLKTTFNHLELFRSTLKFLNISENTHFRYQSIGHCEGCANTNTICTLEGT